MDVYQRRRLVALSALAAIFIVIVLLIRSCGGDDEEAPVTPLAGATGTGGATVLTQNDYADQADAICLEANTSLANVDESDAAQAASDRSEIITGELQQLQTLPPPDDGENKLDNFLGALEELAAAYADQATAAERGDDAAVAELDTTIDELNSTAARAAENFGMSVCGDPTQTGDTETDADTGGGTADETAVEPTAPTEEIAPAPTEIVPEAAPTEPAPTEPAPTEPAPTDAGGEAAPGPEGPTDTGGTESGSGGVSP
jgi:hypothetical protein